MPNYISAIKLPSGDVYQIKDSGALRLTGGQVTGPVNFGDSVYISDLNVGTLIVTGNAAFTNNIQANTINGVEVGPNPKFTDTGTVTSVAVAAANNSGITVSGSPITSVGTITIGLNLSNAINGLGEGSSPANRNDYAVVQYAGGGTSTVTYLRRKLSNVFAALNSTDITNALGGNKNANVVFAGPSSGTAATPSFRALVEADIPGLAWSKITSGNDDLKAIEALTGTSGLLKKTAANTWTLDTSTYLTAATLPTAANDTLGGIKIGYTTSGKKYPVQLDSNSKAYVQVPWADNNTTYTAGTGLNLSGTTFNHSNSITAGTAGTLSTTSSTNRQIAIPYITYDAQGHITASGTHTHTIESFPEAYLTWGGKNFSGSYGPIDAAMIPQLGANRFAFLKPAGIEIEYSTDGGESWNDYAATNGQKVGLFSTSGAFYLGKAATKENNNINNMLRVTITTNLASIYTTLNKIAIYMSTYGNTVWVKIERATQAAPTNYITHLDWTQISGWSGWNILNISDLTTYGNTPSQNQKVRFVFKQTSVSAKYSSSGIWCIYGFGGVGWTVPSNMAKNGHLYSYDSNQNATFPAQITATQFNGNATSATSASFLINKTLDSSTIDRTAGSFTFQGSAAPWAGTDWVGLQIDSGSDKFQIHALSSTTLQYRQNDSGGTNSNWSDWQSLLSSGNYTDYTVTKTGTGASGTWGINVSGTAAKLSALSSSDNASSTSTWRSVWMSYSDGTTGRPALSSVFQYQTSSNTLKAPHFLAEHITNGKNEFQIKYGSTHDISFMIGNGNKNCGIWDAKGGATGTGQWMIFADENHKVTVNGNATSATKATQDESGNNIKTNYASSLSVDGTTFTLKSKSGASLSTIALTSDNIPNLNASQIAAGTLTVAQGGTGKVSWTQWGVLYASATNTLTNTAAGAANTALMGKGSAAPAFVSVSPSVTIATGSTSGPTIKVKVLGVQSSVATIPAASTSQSGIITTGEQRFRGKKGLPWIDLYAENNGTVSQYCDIIFKNNAGTKVGQIFYDMGNPTNITKGRMYFRGYSPATALGTSTTGFYEQFVLPSITVGCTTNHTYDILTRKDTWDITEKDDLTWADHKTDIPTINTIAYWNGRYSNSSSNLTYCVKGEFTDAAVRDLTNTLDNTNKIPVSSAVKAYIDDSISTIQGTVQGGYVTIAGNAQEVTGRKTLSNLAGASFKPAEGSESCNISYNQGLGALVFSFAK